MYNVVNKKYGLKVHCTCIETFVSFTCIYACTLLFNFESFKEIESLKFFAAMKSVL